MDKLSQLMYFITMTVVLAISIIFMLSKDGIVRKAVIAFLLCLDWSLFARWMTMDNRLWSLKPFWIILPFCLGSIFLLIVLIQEILRKIKEKNA